MAVEKIEEEKKQPPLGKTVNSEHPLRKAALWTKIMGHNNIITLAILERYCHQQISLLSNPPGDTDGTHKIILKILTSERFPLVHRIAPVCKQPCPMFLRTCCLPKQTLSGDVLKHSVPHYLRWLIFMAVRGA